MIYIELTHMETIGLQFEHSIYIDRSIWVKTLCLISHESVGIWLDFALAADIGCWILKHLVDIENKIKLLKYIFLCSHDPYFE